MTFFAAPKTASQDHLISWPRIQRPSPPNLPHTSPPGPTLFAHVRARPTNLHAISLNVQSFFNYFSLPPHLSDLFPFPRVRLRDFPRLLFVRIR